MKLDRRKLRRMILTEIKRMQESFTSSAGVDVMYSGRGSWGKHGWPHVELGAIQNHYYAMKRQRGMTPEQYVNNVLLGEGVTKLLYS